METKDVIIKILQILEEALDEKKLDITEFNEEELGISSEKRNYVLEMMQDDGLIKGLTVIPESNQRAPRRVGVSNIQITVKGIMFLSEHAANEQ